MHLSGTADVRGPDNSHGGSGAERRTQEEEAGRDWSRREDVSILDGSTGIQEGRSEGGLGEKCVMV